MRWQDREMKKKKRSPVMLLRARKHGGVESLPVRRDSGTQILG